jgi:hypothetical protein
MCRSQMAIINEKLIRLISASGTVLSIVYSIGLKNVRSAVNNKTFRFTSVPKWFNSIPSCINRCHEQIWKLRGVSVGYYVTDKVQLFLSCSYFLKQIILNLFVAVLNKEFINSAVQLCIVNWLRLGFKLSFKYCTNNRNWLSWIYLNCSWKHVS